MMKRSMALALLIFFSPLAALADFDKGLVRFEQGDYAAAYREMKVPADAGDARAQYIVGVMRRDGLGVEPDDERAHYWLGLAAEANHMEAQVELAQLYRDGRGVAQDFGRMLEWYQRAATLGHVGAQLFVADAYAYGQGIEVDLIAAYVWYEVARQYWGDLAKHAQEYVARKLDPEQLDEAKREAVKILASMEP